MDELILKKEGPILYITINREKVLNALNLNIIEKLTEIFDEIEKDEEVLIVIITGAGKKAFVSGADIEEIMRAGRNRTEMILKGQILFSKIRNSSKVVIAAINGYALGGGCELALSCDIRISSERAIFGFPETKLGLIPGYGGTQLLPRLIGIGRAKYMIFSGESITAKEAYEFGLVEKVVKEEDLVEEVKKLAERIAKNGPIAVKASKRAIDQGIELSINEALMIELKEYEKVSNSEDAEEGIISFLERRSPSFKGR